MSAWLSLILPLPMHMWKNRDFLEFRMLPGNPNKHHILQAVSKLSASSAWRETPPSQAGRKQCQVQKRTSHIKTTVGVLLCCFLKFMGLLPSSGRQLLGFIFAENLNPSKRYGVQPYPFLHSHTYTVHRITVMRGSCMLCPPYASYTDTKQLSREITLTERGLSGSIHLALPLHSLFRISPPPPPPG